MNDLQKLGERANRARVDLLFIDADVALTMLDLVPCSQIEDLKKRRINEALRAYSFVREHIPTVSLTPSETVALNKKMAVLKLRLSLP